MANESIHQVAPAIRIRVRGVALPIKDAVLRSGKRLGSKAEFNERLDMAGLQAVIKLVDLCPVIDGLAIFGSHGSQHVVKDGVKANVAETEFVHRQLELSLAIVANQRAGIIGADRQVEEAIHRASRSGEIGDNLPWGVVSLSGNRRNERGDKRTE